MSQFVPYIFFLACPLTMGAMMWFMMRGSKSQSLPQANSAEQLTQMRAEIDQLRAAQRDSSEHDTNISRP